MPDYDLLIRGGTLVDGSGEPPREADVAILDGRIAEVAARGTLHGTATREIDADGLLVTPGFVDVHTHYDGHVTWESRLRPSSCHGVTTAVIGNCGVGFAPCRPGDRDTLIRLMDGVEDIPYPVLSQGLCWEWESFPDFLDLIDGREYDMDVAAYLPHAALRVFVMGERGANREPASEDDVRGMCALLDEALEAGAMGLATSRTIFHRSSDGESIPTLDASDDELLALARTMGEAGKGVFQIVEDIGEPGKGIAPLRRIAEASGRPLTVSLGAGNTGPAYWRDIVRDIDHANAEGVEIKGQVMPRAIGLLLGPELTLNPFYTTAGYLGVADLPLEERVARLRDPATRARILREELDPDPKLVLGRMVRDFDHMFLLGNPPEYEQAWERSVAGRAKAAGVSPEELAYDLMVEGERGGVLYLAMANYADGCLDAVGAMLSHEDVIPGLGDGGAHAATICDGSYSTFLLTHWGRDRADGRMPIERLVHKLTRAPASLMGLRDRGLVAPGMKADLNVIDFERLALHPPEIVQDLPGGGTRLVQGAEGYVATIVRGEAVYLEGAPTGALTGRLVRGPQSAS